jgi:hypothetical protein
MVVEIDEMEAYRQKHTHTHTQPLYTFLGPTRYLIDFIRIPEIYTYVMAILHNLFQVIMTLSSCYVIVGHNIFTLHAMSRCFRGIINQYPTNPFTLDYQLKLYIPFKLHMPYKFLFSFSHFFSKPISFSKWHNVREPSFTILY